MPGPAVLSLGRAEARRIALAAQGFRDPAHAVPSLRTLQRTVDRTGVLQVDSVNVLVRAHYMPLFSRMGPYDPSLLERAITGRPRRLVEYWAHVQALMPVELWPVMRHRMEYYRSRRGKWRQLADTTLPEQLLRLIADGGAATARELDEGAPRRKDHWGWNWSAERQALDYLFTVGDLCITRRNAQFECVYDLPERVIPAEVLARPVPTKAEADVELVRRAARSHGVATPACLADYYRMSMAETKAAIEVLVEDGELLPARIEGWNRPAYLHAEAARARRVEAATLLSPFDPVVWFRERALRLFDFHYRIEIYVPAPQRQYGYYVLPFLLGDQIVARVDLKADRATGRLLVPAIHLESGAPSDTRERLAAELARMASWLGLEPPN